QLYKPAHKCRVGKVHSPFTFMVMSLQYYQRLSDYRPPSLGYTQGTGRSQVPQSKYAEQLTIIKEDWLGSAWLKQNTMPDPSHLVSFERFSFFFFFFFYKMGGYSCLFCPEETCFQNSNSLNFSPLFPLMVH
uniref:Uncharacterized protein n=1 Tax=Balaenoptera musculus TaxID=9771 RepID=A0A8C0HSC7_BALMU